MSTYTPIASITLASAASSVTFSGIPQTYTDLVIVCNYSNSVDSDIYIRYNSDSASNYSRTSLFGNGSSALSERVSNATFNRIAFANANKQINCITQIQNYSNTTTNKTAINRMNNAGDYVFADALLWRSTAAITSVSITASSGNMASGSTFNLYGIANASITNVAKATGGDSVYTDGTYWYHIFRSSGTFTPTQALTADYLVVAGGGGGGNNVNYGGGGGAGGLRCTVGATGGGGSLESALSLTAQAYTVTVGGGGTPGSGGAYGTDGSNSVFSTITSSGGGAGAAGANNGRTGGSGGAAGYHNANQTGGAGTANQGYAGGNNFGTAGPYTSGGGGGAGAAGANATQTVNGNGGNGVTTSISGTSTTYAGGGGGGSPATATAGTGGTGGGGNGAVGSIGSAGTANTGGGGGNGGAGGSGIVIVRYAA